MVQQKRVPDPDFSFYYNATFRDIADLSVNENLLFHTNILFLSQTKFVNSLASISLAANDYQYRSKELEYEKITDNTDNNLQFDKLFATYYSNDGALSLKIGRQAVNLSIGMFFYPK